MQPHANSRTGDTQRLKFIGEILSRGVERLLCSQELDMRKAAQARVSTTDTPFEETDELIAAVMKYGEITTGEAIRITGMSRSTTRRRLAELVAQGELYLRGQGRGAKYTLLASVPKT